jgi:hypothetical protein
VFEITKEEAIMTLSVPSDVGGGVTGGSVGIGTEADDPAVGVGVTGGTVVGPGLVGEGANVGALVGGSVAASVVGALVGGSVAASVVGALVGAWVAAPSTKAIAFTVLVHIFCKFSICPVV